MAKTRNEDIYMRTVTWVSLVCGVLLIGGCSGGFGMAGKWRGAVMEQNQATLVELDLQPTNNSAKGTLTIFSNTGDEATAGTSYEIVNANRSGNRIDFIVPITGEIDADAVFFELILEKGRLAGYGREMRRGAETLPVELKKQK